MRRVTTSQWNHLWSRGANYQGTDLEDVRQFADKLNRESGLTRAIPYEVADVYNPEYLSIYGVCHTSWIDAILTGKA